MTDVAGFVGIGVGVVALVTAIWGVSSSYTRRNTQFEDHCKEDARFREGLEKRLCKIDELEKESKDAIRRMGEIETASRLAAQKADLLWALIEKHAGKLLKQTENPLTSEEKARIVSGELTVSEAKQVIADLEQEIACHSGAPHEALVHILVEAHVKRLILDKHGVAL